MNTRNLPLEPFFQGFLIFGGNRMQPKLEVCPWCQSGYPLWDKNFSTVVAGKVREVTRFDCGTQVVEYYYNSKNRREWIKTCRSTSVPIENKPK